MGAVHNKLGRVQKTSNTGWQVRNFNFKTSIILQQKTEFEHGSAVETFSYAVNKDGVTLLAYNIHSLDLVTL